MTRKARTLSKITVEQEPGVADTLLTAELDDTHIPPSFAELGVRDEIVRALAEIGIERTFAIQELTLPLALAGDDLIGQARTGMGKTFGFGVPLLHRIATAEHRHRPARRHPARAGDRADPRAVHPGHRGPRERQQVPDRRTSKFG